MAKQLSENDLTTLRSRGLLRETETAFKEGVVIIAEDLVTHVRRVINASSDLMLEANRQILND